MQCHIYRSSIKQGLYVWLKDKDGIEALPKPVQKQLGVAEFAMTIELTPTRTLGQEDPEVVLASLEEHGFHLQMPRDIEALVETIARSTTSR